MYGRGNYGPQFGQGLQRPMSPYQLPPAGAGQGLQRAALHFQSGQPFLMQPVMQQGGAHHAVPPRGSGYPPGPPNMAPQGRPLGSGSNAGQSFMQQPLGYGGPPTQPPYPVGQPNFSSGVQNPHHLGALPPPPSVAPPRALPPPPLQRPAGFGLQGPQSTSSAQQGVHHMSIPPPLPPPPPQAATGFYPRANFVSAIQQPSAESHMPPPPPPLPSSSPPVAPLPPLAAVPINVQSESPFTSVDGGHSQMHESESTGEQKKDGHEGDSTSVHKDSSLKQSEHLELTPPPKPADDKLVRNIEVLCQYIAKNGPEFEERVRKNESANPEFCFLIGGDPGTEASRAQAYYLWMKKKCGHQNTIDKKHADDEASAQPSSFPNVVTAQSPADSDVDMEDDITQSDKEPGVYNLGGNSSSDPVSPVEVSEMQTEENTLQYPRSSSLQLSSPVKSETMPLDSSDQPHSDKEPGVYNLGGDLSSDPVSPGEVSEMQTQQNTLQYPRSLALQLSSPVESETMPLDSSDQPHSDKEPGPLSPGEVSEMQTQDNTLQYPSSLALQLSSSVKSQTIPLDSGDQPPGIESPFRLISNYASDDNSEDDEPSLGKGTIKPISPPRQSACPNTHDDYGCSDVNSTLALAPKRLESVTAWAESPLADRDSEAVQKDPRGTLPKDSSPRKHEMDEKYRGIEPSNPNAAFRGEYGSGSRGVDTMSCEVTGREYKKSTAAAPKVDEFGRLIKEGASDSESDGSRHMRRRGRRDRSRSPSDRRRRRSPWRSPRRRKDRRSPSRSWSPRRRRSRSRSPFQSGGDFNSEKLRRANVQALQCFDFMRGRCYRGASCRYLHHDVDKNENSSSFKSRQYQADVASARNFGFGENEHRDMRGQVKSLRQDGSAITSKIKDKKTKAEPKTDAVSSIVPYGAEILATVESDVYRNKDQVQGASEEPSSQLPRADDNSTSARSPMVQPLTHPTSAETHRRVEDDPKPVLGTAETDSSAVRTSMLSPSGTSVTEPCQREASNECRGPFASIANLSHQTSHLPPSPLASLSAKPQQELEGHLDHNAILPSVSFPPQSAPVQSITGYQGPVLTQQSHYPVPPSSAWGMLPLPQPRPSNMVDPSVSGASLQFSQGIPLRPDFPGQTTLKAQSGQFHGPPQVGGFQYHAYQLPSDNVPGQASTGPSLIRDDRSSQFPSNAHAPVRSFAPGAPPQPAPFVGDTTVKNMASYPGRNIPVVESCKPTLYNDQHPQLRLPPYGLSLTAADSMSSHLGGSLPLPGYASKSVDTDQPSRFLDVGGSRISAHYNPYASTFDQPLSTRFGSTAFLQKETTAVIKYDGSFSHSGNPMEGQKVGAYGSSQIMSSPNSSRVGGHTLPRSGGDQYDPLFDSIEPSKRTQKLDHAADNSDTSKVSSRHMVLDVAENNKHKEIGAVVAPASCENDEYGETADAEVGAVEDGSSSDPEGDAAIAEGEIEIDQVKSEGNRNKSKDSRSMKLFKVAVANFVKDVLKPQWRQGNMSKEVFKTIVKKTVDKVSGAMKNHRLPKSQAKIDHYIDSSRRKLTQLVEGYVSKYKS